LSELQRFRAGGGYRHLFGAKELAAVVLDGIEHRAFTHGVGKRTIYKDEG